MTRSGLLALVLACTWPDPVPAQPTGREQADRFQGRAVQSETFICYGADRSKDQASSAAVRGGTELRIHCQMGLIDGVARLTPFSASFFEPSPRTRVSASGVRSCLSTFQQYKSRGDVHAIEISRSPIPRCKLDGGPRGRTDPASLILARQSLRRASAGIPRGIARYAESKNPTAELVYIFEKVIWGNDWQASSPQVAFFTDGKPTYPGVVAELFAGTSPPKLAPSCANWSNPPGLKAMYYFNTQSSVPHQAQLDSAGWVASGMKEPVMSVGSLPLDALKAFKSALGTQSQGWLRLVPVDGKSGQMSCAARPGGWLKLDFGPSPQQQFVATMKELLDLSRKHEQDYKAALDAHLVGAESGLKSPVLVKLIGYAPPGDRARYLTAWSPLGKSFGIADEIPWPDKYRQGWFEGCAYDPDGFYQAALHKKHDMPDTVWEWVVFTLKAWAGLYQLLQGALVEGFGYVTTAGACPFNDPTAAPADQAEACALYKKGLGAGLHLAMSSVGLPPELPSTTDLAEPGAEYLAGLAVDYAIAQTAGPLGQQGADAIAGKREQLVAAARNQLLEAAKRARCPLRATSLADAKAKGYDNWNPLTHCAEKNGSVLNFGRLGPIAAGGPWTAVAWIEVRRNPAYTGAESTASISVTTRFKMPVQSAQIPASFLAAVENNRLSPLAGGSVEVDADSVPPQGLRIPIVLQFPERDWAFAVRRLGLAGNQASSDSWELNLARAYWRQMLANTAQSLAVDVSYRFTDDPKLLSPCVDTSWGQEICSTFSGTASAPAGGIDGPLGRVHDGLSYGLPPVPQSCPGFEHLPPYATGLPRGVRTKVTADDDF